MVDKEPEDKGFMLRFLLRKRQIQSRRHNDKKLRMMQAG